MTGRSFQKRILPALVLLYFALTVFIHFLHTETAVNGGSDCPACRFNSSNTSPVPSIDLHPPTLLFVDWMPDRDDPAAGATPDIRLCPRAPPAG